MDRMLFMRMFFVLLMSVVVPSYLTGQKSWRLEDCIEYAYQHNLQIKREIINTDIARYNYTESVINLLPSLNGFANHGYNWGSTFNYDLARYTDQNYFNGNFGYESRLQLFGGFEKIHAIQKNKYRLLSNEQNAEKVKNEIALALTATYLQVLLDEELVKLAEEQYQTTLSQVQRMDRLYEIGNEAKGKLLELKAQAADESVMITTRNSMLKLDYLELMQMMDLDSGEYFLIIPPDSVQLMDFNHSEDVRSVYNQASGLPQIKSSEYDLLGKKKELAESRAQRIPKLSVSFLNYSRYSELAPHPTLLDSDPDNDIYNYPYVDQVKDYEYKELNFRLSIPILNGWSANTRIKTSKVQVLDAEYKLEQTRQTLMKVIQQAVTNVESAWQKYLAMQTSVASYHEAFVYAEEKFNVGMLNTVDYNIAKNNLTKAESELLQAKYDYIFKLKILEFYQGKPLTL